MDVGDLDQDNLFNNDTEDAEVEPTLADLADNDGWSSKLWVSPPPVLQVMPSPMSTSRILTLEEIAMGNNYQPEQFVDVALYFRLWDTVLVWLMFAVWKQLSPLGLQG